MNEVSKYLLHDNIQVTVCVSVHWAAVYKDIHQFCAHVV